ncbi:MAG: hypothetical protein ACYTKD_19080 [Planctomycetota bacterium]|jgi:lipopolysaccharide export system protein LptA
MSLAPLAFSALFAAASAAAAERPLDAKPAPEPVRVECEGQVTYRAGKDGRTHLVLAGGVNVTRGKTVLSARAADAVLARGGQSPELMRAEGDVALRSPAFSARADAAEMRAVPPAPGAGTDPGADEKKGTEKGAKADSKRSAPPAYEVKLERRELAEVELRAGDVLVACRGPLTYASRSREARLTGGVRAESPKLRARCREATVVLREREPPATKEKKGGEKPREPATPEGPARKADPEARAGKTEPESETDRKSGKGKDKKAEGPALPAVRSVELVGDVVLDAPKGKGSEARRVRAARALYSVAEETVAFTGEPAPVVEYGGMTLTAPEIVLHLKENRIVPKGGRMRAVIGPAK